MAALHANQKVFVQRVRVVTSGNVGEEQHIVYYRIVSFFRQYGAVRVFTQ